MAPAPAVGAAPCPASAAREGEEASSGPAAEGTSQPGVVKGEGGVQASTARYSEEDKAGLRSGALVCVGPFAFPHPSTLPPPPPTYAAAGRTPPPPLREGRFPPLLTVPPPPLPSPLSVRRLKKEVFAFPSAERGDQFVPTLPLDEAGDVLAMPSDHLGPGLTHEQGPVAATAGHGVGTRA